MKDANTDVKDSSGILKTGDELSTTLDITVPDVPEDILFPDELNRYLRDRVQQLTQQNAMAQKKIEDYEESIHASNSKIVDLHRKLADFQNAQSNSSFVTAANASCAKIIELSKKLREKCAEIEALKTKYSKAEKLLKEYSKKLHQQEEVPENLPVKDVPLDVDKIKALEDKLSSTSVRLFDVKNQNRQLKNDLKAATKLLRQEIGESFESLQSLVNMTPNWRGRAQVICDLQQKVLELKEKLKEKESGNKGNKTVISNRCKIEKRSELLINENKDLKQALEDNKKRLDASKARCRVLETECNSIRIKFSAISDQAERDRELITSLMGQVSHLRSDHTIELKEKQKIIERLEKALNSLKAELHREKCINENLQKDLNARQTSTVVVQEKISDNSHYKNITSKLEAEKLRLLELFEITNSKLEKERELHSETQNLYRIERQKAARLESKLVKLQLENSCRGSEYSGISSLSRQMQVSLEDQLELAKENIKSLKARLDLEKQERKADFLEFSKILQNYRQDVSSIDCDK